MNLDILTDFAAQFSRVTADEQRAARERAKRPGQGHLRQYGERPTRQDKDRIVPNHACMGVRR